MKFDELIKKIAKKDYSIILSDIQDNKRASEHGITASRMIRSYLYRRMSTYLIIITSAALKISPSKLRSICGSNPIFIRKSEYLHHLINSKIDLEIYIDEALYQYSSVFLFNQNDTIEIMGDELNKITPRKVNVCTERSGEIKHKKYLNKDFVAIIISIISLFVSTMMGFYSIELQDQLNKQEQRVNYYVEVEQRQIQDNNSYLDYVVSKLQVSLEKKLSTMELDTMYSALLQYKEAKSLQAYNSLLLVDNNVYELSLLKLVFLLRNYDLSKIQYQQEERDQINEYLSALQKAPNFIENEYGILFGIAYYYTFDYANAINAIEEELLFTNNDSDIAEVANYWFGRISLRIRSNHLIDKDVNRFLKESYNSCLETGLMKVSLCYLFEPNEEISKLVLESCSESRILSTRKFEFDGLYGYSSNNILFDKSTIMGTTYFDLEQLLEILQYLKFVESNYFSLTDDFSDLTIGEYDPYTTVPILLLLNEDNISFKNGNIIITNDGDKYMSYIEYLINGYDHYFVYDLIFRDIVRLKFIDVVYESTFSREAYDNYLLNTYEYLYKCYMSSEGNEELMGKYAISLIAIMRAANDFDTTLYSNMKAQEFEVAQTAYRNGFKTHVVYNILRNTLQSDQYKTDDMQKFENTINFEYEVLFLHEYADLSQ